MINYKYNINFMIKDIDNVIYQYSERITFVTILDDYFNSVNSAIKVGFFVNPDMHNKLELRASKMTYSISITSNETSPRQNVTTSYKDYYLENFKIKPVNVPVTVYKSDNASENANRNDYIQVIMDFIPETVLTYNRYMCNGIYNNATVNDVLLYLLNKMEIPVIYEEPHNNTKYSQIILPPNNLFMSLKFLHQQYGIYNNGVSMWFKGNLFCFKNRYNSINTPKINNRNINNVRIFVDKNISENFNLYGEGTKLNSQLNIYEYYTRLEKVLIDDNKIALEELYGNKYMVYSKNLDGTYNMTNDLINKSNEDKLKIYWNGIENPTVVNQYFNEIKNPVTLTIDYNSANLSMWSPLNRFRFHIKTENILFDRYVNSYFQVSKNEMFFTTNGAEATLQGKVTLVEIGSIVDDNKHYQYTSTGINITNI